MQDKTCNGTDITFLVVAIKELQIDGTKHEVEFYKAKDYIHNNTNKRPFNI